MATYNAGPSGDKKVAFAYDKPPSHPPSLLPPPYVSDGGSSSHQPQGIHPFAPSPYGDPTTPLSGDNPKGFKQHLKNLAPGKSPSKLLDPPPPSFTRPPPIDLPYGAFPVMELICNGSTLDKGFPYAAPACPIEPHPFVTHDVNENDWRWFLHDVRVAGSLSPMNRVVAGVLPIVFPLGLVLGVAAAFGTERYMKSRKKGPVSELIDQMIHLLAAFLPSEIYPRRALARQEVETTRATAFRRQMATGHLVQAMRPTRGGWFIPQ